MEIRMKSIWLDCELLNAISEWVVESGPAAGVAAGRWRADD